MQFNLFIYSPWKFVWSTDIQKALLLVYWPPHSIAIYHSSIGLKKLTIQLVFIEAWLCVVMRFLHHNTSEVCTATLIFYFLVILWVSGISQNSCETLSAFFAHDHNPVDFYVVPAD